MKKLISKEFRLAASPLTYLFLLASLMTLLPGYPILVGTFFITLGIFYSFQRGRESNDILYSVLLPVKKRDVVKAKYIFTALVEGAAFAGVSALTALRMTVLSTLPAYTDNALMNATPFYLGFVLLIFAAFNVLFLGLHFRTAWKIGVPFLSYAIVAFVLIFAGEAAHFFPGLAWLNAPGGEKLVSQFAFAGICAVVYAAATLLSCIASRRRFEKIDL